MRLNSLSRVTHLPTVVEVTALTVVTVLTLTACRVQVAAERVAVLLQFLGRQTTVELSRSMLSGVDREQTRNERLMV